MAKQIKRKALFFAGLMGLGFISLVQGMFHTFSFRADTRAVPDSQLKRLLTVNQAEADAPVDVVATGIDPTPACPAPGGCK